MNLSDAELKKLGTLGFIPGPLESDKQFFARASQKDPEHSVKHYPILFELLKKLLNVAPSWVPVDYSNQSLAPWEGAALWTEQTKQGFCAKIQLRKGFKKGRFLFYSREEVLFHETIHALRVGFNEPRFEEILAYYHSKSTLRRLIGPFFSSPKQAYFFLASIGMSFFGNFYSFFSVVPLLFLLGRGFFLIQDLRIFKKAMNRVKGFFPNTSPFRVLLALTGAEIELFAQSSRQEIEAYIEEHQHDLRWRQTTLL